MEMGSELSKTVSILLHFFQLCIATIKMYHNDYLVRRSVTDRSLLGCFWVCLILCALIGTETWQRSPRWQVATFIVQKILLDDVGLAYICATAERFFAVSAVLANMVQMLAEQPSVRLLKHIIRCYLRLSDNPRWPPSSYNAITRSRTRSY